MWIRSVLALAAVSVGALSIPATEAAALSVNATAPYEYGSTSRHLTTTECTQETPKQCTDPQIAVFKEIDFDIFTLSVYWWKGHCATSADIAKCKKVPESWTKNFVVHGLWPGYSDKFKKDRKTTERGPDGKKLPCVGTQYDSTLAPSTTAATLVFPGEGVSNKNPDFHKYQYEKHGVCSQMGQANYFAKAVELGTEANTKLATLPAASRPGTVTIEDLQEKLGSNAQIVCKSDAGGAYLWFVNFCYKRQSGVGKPTPCPEPGNCVGTITLK